MLDAPENRKLPTKPTTRNKNTVSDFDSPGPLTRRGVSHDNLEDIVSTNTDKKKKAAELGRRLTKLEHQLYGTSSGYGTDTEAHELDHSLADSEGRFRLAYDKKTQDIVPGWESSEIRSPRERMKIASAPKDMSDHDKRVYEKAKRDLEIQKRKAIITSILVGTPLCGALLCLATQILK